MPRAPRSEIEVNGEGASEIDRFLKADHPDDGKEEIVWNFTKFLVGLEEKVAPLLPAPSRVVWFPDH